MGLILGALVPSGFAQSPVPPEFLEATQAMREGKLDEAAAGFRAAAKRQPAFAEAHFNLGLADEELANYDEAISSFREALKLKPRLRGANLFLGIAEFRLNNLDAAAQSVNKEVSAYPRDANAWMWLGIIRLAEDRPEDAVEALDKAAKLKPGDQDILYHRGRAHLMVSKNSYAEMFKLNPDSWLVHRVLAQANAEADRHVDAIAEYQIAIKLAPTQRGLHEELGSEYLELNKIPEAEAELRQELAINPHNALATYKLGVVAVDRGDGANGKQLIQSAQREKPGMTHMDYNLGRAEMLLGENESAAQEFELAIKSDSDPEVVRQAWYQLGTAYRRLHRIEDARMAISKYETLREQSERRQKTAREKYREEHPNLGDTPPEPGNPQ